MAHGIRLLLAIALAVAICEGSTYRYLHKVHHGHIQTFSCRFKGGFRIVNSRFTYHGNQFRVTCSRGRLFSLWNNCLHRHNTIIQCFREMRKRNVFRLVGEHSTCSKLIGHSSRGHIIHHAIIHGHHAIIHGHHAIIHGHHPITHGHHISHHPIIHGHPLSHNSRFIHGHHISYIDYYNRYHGFRIVDSRFQYNGLTYQLTCSGSRFYSLWGECYTRYHSRSRCFEYLRTQALFAPFGGIGIGRRFTNGPQISYNDYYNRYHGFRIVDSRFYYNGLAYRLSCSSQRFYSLWGDCYTRYHSRSRCFGYLRTQGLFAPFGGHGFGVSRYNNRFASGHHISYNNYYNRFHGFRIVDRRFYYNGLSYRLSCSSQRFYSLWGDCYTRYHSRSRCFGYLRTQGLFAPFGGHGFGVSRYNNRFASGHHISYNNYYNRFHGFRIVDRRFYYNGLSYRLSCSSQRFYSLWGDCYTRYHSRNRCFEYLRTQGLFAPFGGHGIRINRFNTRSISGHPISYNEYYNRYHGFRIVDRGFRYNGLGYRLSCSSQRFYSLWGDCYTRYHSRTRCFAYLRTQGLFASFGGHGIGVSRFNTRSISGHPISYNDYYNRYHGFRIANSQFYYNGLAYRLACNSQRFYRLWGDCYTRYHSRSRCFGYLRTLGLFTPFGGHGIGVNRFSTRSISGHSISYNDYYNRYHGFRIVNSQFNYNGIAYRLSCSSQRFYSLWGNCYTRYHSRSRCFGYLRTQGLFAPLGGHVVGAIHTGLIIGHAISYNDYYKRYHGFRILNSQFKYNGVVYRLSCSSQRFYNLWSNCYNRYHSRISCLGFLSTQGLFAAVGGNFVGPIHTGLILGNAISYNDYYKRYHGFRILNSQFKYNGVVYRLSCSSQRFYNLWSNCYYTYTSRSSCLGFLSTQGLFAAVGGHVTGAINTGLISGHSKSYNDYYNRYHGFRIINRQFHYNGLAYRLSCSSKLFYNLWGNCYTRYHSRSKCFGYLKLQGIIAPFGGHGIGAVNTKFVSGHHISYNDYYNRYHGFRIVNSQFNYHGSAYRLSCSSQRFYSIWGNCYTKFHSRSRCFKYLRTQGLFAPFRGHILGLKRRADVVVHHIHEFVRSQGPNSHY